MSEQYAALRANVSLLGQLLGQTIKQAKGQATLDKVEQIRQLAKSARSGNTDDRNTLLHVLHTLSDEELLPVVRAFSQFLNLANVAEQFHGLSRYNPEGFEQNNPLLSTLSALTNSQCSNKEITQAIDKLDINIVLTAHPTEVTRRTLINKHVELSDCLAALELQDLQQNEQGILLSRMEQLIAQAWHTNEIRPERPTPLDEAKWGFAVIENSLWQAAPQFIRQLSAAVKAEFNHQVDLAFSPVRFTSWMGGDRDGNPYVTAEVTKSVLDHGRWMALQLYRQDIDTLINELSMHHATSLLISQAGQEYEPYRALLKKLRDDIDTTHAYLQSKIVEKTTRGQDVIQRIEQIRTPLKHCYDSLHKLNMGVIADGLLLDTLRRTYCFGLHLSQLDIRQDSSRHSQVFQELLTYLDIGDYSQWSEKQKQQFLLTELASKRPLLPLNWQPSNDVQEVLNTFALIAKQPPEKLGIYVISMAKSASDVLAVHLLLQATGCRFALPVAPLFETLDDLNNAYAVIYALYQQPWYQTHISGRQYVMIGYSDSAKDAGMMAAGWAQYQAMEQLVSLSEAENIDLVLFHGRGGTVGRGGAPAAKALSSQPPGSLKHGLRVTEQGEMIRFKFGLPAIALQSLTIYASAILQSNLLPPLKPQQLWRDVMETISDTSCQRYREIVRYNPDFVAYFRMATPEQELGKLPLGSRPAKRNPQGGVESLRAIPWIFAWSQNRLMLPAWLGAYAGLSQAINQVGKDTLLTMSEQWPFFRTRLEMLEMVFCKADGQLSQHYDENLVEPHLQKFGAQLRDELTQAIELVKSLNTSNTLLADQPWLRQSIGLRNPYTDPLNVLQVELLKRARSHPSKSVDHALMITMAGIAAGMRNTG